MTTILAAIEDELLVVRGEPDGPPGGWELETRLDGNRRCGLAVDPGRPAQVWCGTAGAGVWRSADGGATWSRAGSAFEGVDVSAIAVAGGSRSPADGPGPLYAGTDPTSLHRSDDAGQTWEALDALLRLPSAPTWSFPPRPDTSHVRWITIDPADDDVLFVCIEAGALVSSRDGGRTWLDRGPHGPCHTPPPAGHPLPPGRLY